MPDKSPAEEPVPLPAMPPDRRAAAKAYAAGLSATAAKVASGLPLSADVDDFRRVLVAEARP